MKKHRTTMPRMPGISRRKPATLDDRGSSVESVDYSPETKQLTVTFRGGRQYRYDDVPKEIAETLEASGSKGSFINTNIIGRYNVEKLT